jgi:hypothetical protein
MAFWGTCAARCSRCFLREARGPDAVAWRFAEAQGEFLDSSTITASPTLAEPATLCYKGLQVRLACGARQNTMGVILSGHFVTFSRDSTRRDMGMGLANGMKELGVVCRWLVRAKRPPARVSLRVGRCQGPSWALVLAAMPRADFSSRFPALFVAAPTLAIMASSRMLDLLWLTTAARACSRRLFVPNGRARNPPPPPPPSSPPSASILDFCIRVPRGPFSKRTACRERSLVSPTVIE